MKLSRRAKRMQRNHIRNSKHPRFNMISLMDIFTILVFFLLVNSSDVQLQNTKDVTLPQSIADQKPRETLNILVTEKAVFVKDRQIITLEDAKRGKTAIIPALKTELDLQASLYSRSSAAEEGFEITISGDKAIPFSLLKRIMTTCTQANFSRISLSVMQKSVES